MYDASFSLFSGCPRLTERKTPAVGSPCRGWPLRIRMGQRVIQGLNMPCDWLRARSRRYPRHGAPVRQARHYCTTWHGWQSERRDFPQIDPLMQEPAPVDARAGGVDAKSRRPGMARCARPSPNEWRRRSYKCRAATFRRRPRFRNICAKPSHIMAILERATVDRMPRGMGPRAHSSQFLASCFDQAPCKQGCMEEPLGGYPMNWNHSRSGNMNLSRTHSRSVWP